MLTCKSSKFSLPKNETYLNCAYMSPLLKTVEKAGLTGVRMKRNPAAIRPEDFFTIVSALKMEFADLIQASNPGNVAIIPSVSYGLATVTRNMKIGRGEHVLVAAEQFPSNYYPWESLCAETGATIKVIHPEKNLRDRGKVWNRKFLESIGPGTRVVAMAHTHWADGTLFDLEAIRKRTREVGAALVIDGTQSVGALPFDVQKIQPDALICAAYKWLLGPYSIGLAWYGDSFNEGKPVEENWINRLGSENFSALVNYEPRYQTGAARFSMGEQSNFILVPMALKAISQINRWHVDNIQAYCRAITNQAIDRLRAKDFWVEDAPYRAGHLFGIRHPRPLDMERLKKKLAKNRIHVSIRGDAVRVSPHVYNREQDLDKLVRVIASAV